MGKVITQILKADLILIDEIGFAPMDTTGAELFFRLVAAAYERRSLGIGSHWPFEEWGKFLPGAHHGGQPARPTAASQRHRGHRRGVIPDEGSASERRSIYAGQELNIRSEGWGLLVAKSGD